VTQVIEREASVLEGSSPAITEKGNDQRSKARPPSG